MKHITCLLWVITVVCAHPMFAQSMAPDSVNNKKTIRVSPDQSDTHVNALGNFAVIAKDSLAFQTYSGQSVLNTLRGHLPNLSIGPSSFTVTSALRNGSPMFIVDGLPFSSRIDSYINLRSFEYQNIYAINGAGATQFGGLGSNGAIFLESKSGKGFYKPSFEFNSAPSFTWLEGESQERYEQWYITNAIAYQQDFGKVDTRISYTLSHLPSSNDYLPETKINYHSIKINTGVDVTSKFNIRLVVDENRTVNNYESVFGLWNQEPIPYETSRITNSLQGNLLLRYRVRDWLVLSSQNSLAKIGDLSESTVTDIPESSNDYQRSFNNFFVSVDLPIVKQFSMNAYAGVQLEKQESDWRQNASSNGGWYSNWYTMEGETRTGSGGLGFQYDDFLFINSNYRLDKFSSLPEDDNYEPTYSLTSAFVFSEAFGWNDNVISLGKLRGSFGKSFYTDAQTYPFANPMTYENYLASVFRPTNKRNNEVGLDLGFFKNRITLQATNFYDVNEDFYVLLPIPSGVNGTSYMLFDMGELRTKGWEFVLGTTPILMNDLTMNTKIIVGTFDTKIKSDMPSGNSNLIVPFNPNPDWRGSLLNQLFWKKFFFSFLIDMRKGGDFLTGPDFGSPSSSLNVVDGTLAKLRDASLGYDFSTGGILRQVNVSVSARNLWTIYSQTDKDIEGPMTNQKGVAASITLMF